MKPHAHRPFRFLAALALTAGVATAWYAWAQAPAASAGPAEAAPPATIRAVEPRAEPIVVEVQEGEEGNVLVYRTPDGKVVQMYGGKGPRGGYGAGSSSYGPPHMIPAGAADPEVAKLLKEEQEAAKESQELVEELREADDEAKRKEISEKLRESLSKQFDAQQKRRAHEVTRIEERLAKLKETMKKREAAKEQIVGRRLDELSGVMDELGWEETFGPRRGPNVPGGAYPAPGVQVYPQPVPTLPRLPNPVPVLPPATKGR